MQNIYYILVDLPPSDIFLVGPLRCFFILSLLDSFELNLSRKEDSKSLKLVFQETNVNRLLKKHDFFLEDIYQKKN